MPRPTKDMQRAQRIAREVFGYDKLHAAQKEAIQSVLSGHDTLAIMPTGSGKSAIYQIAALSLSGPTVVVSPLIALQRDQVEALEQNAPGQAALINSTLRPADREATWEALEERELEFLFLAPEQLSSEETLERLRAAEPSLFVVDEAHCVSEWGHDFRPEYLRLGGVVEALGHPTVLALTATAAPPVREEIVERLGMRDARVLVRGFDRPNIHLAVQQFADEGTKRAALLGAVVGAPKPGIVYAATRKGAEEFAHDLQERGVKAAAYHAGMNAAAREEVQTAFMEDELEVIVATTAFGMGIDKPNVRFVHHLDISGSIDAYYQEIGRAGRDGEPAEATLFFAPGDLNLRRFFAGSAIVDADQVEQVLRAVEEQDAPVDPAELREETGLSQTRILSAVSRLEEVGALEVLPGGEVVAVEGTEAPEVAAEAALAQEHRRTFERSRLEMMHGYADTHACRREYLLNYFGEAYSPPCGNCDNCDAGLSLTAEAEGDVPFAIGSRVAHATFGEGQVVRYEGEKVTVLFDQQGYQTLALPIVLENGLLEPVQA
ncbi:RecQ family ATP-dependent DNA helicase [Deinococcus metallilatus]|uniref:ATP-dependent DNA helicase RecQ n=1 Tax=Deinococcus metallilatus TaxID=1211322 RepID=A0AAJ5F0Z0_9DEIO|nr:ATP-dependent DNA helicase RecQ [Deinococcus metallilatus]MBB5297017.1 ATP-dependent DNA helicase RecQ [Deinococcus metallilatus]QBY07850.1 RecQ family ATP-dependent DNA helicase [Deinococcus metallilatus]RXJ13199.1 RecQ family ATP-dependent DNA helicase [Deinococcus metallilatus]TLK23028.1 RecQ family ATP-dependent DNA helicase [Deinococcus metallilatus]GMA15984.1 ATP-dependent DNA helicase RecQ [Deinococcus metallilatus]